MDKEEEQRELQHSDDVDVGVRSVLDEFWMSSTLQGLPRVFTSRFTTWKCFWTIVFLLLVAGCTYQMYSIFGKFYARETTTTVTLVYGDVEFPSITICNMNIARESQLLKSNNTKLVESYKNYKNGSNPAGYMYDLYTHINEMTYSDWETFGHEGKVMLLEPAYVDETRSSQMTWTYMRYSRLVTARYGNCYTLNSAERQLKPFKDNHPGRRKGLSVYLNAQKHEYLYSYTPYSGFLLDLHMFNTTDSIADSGIKLSTGYQYELSLSQVQIHRLEPPYGKCSQEYAKSFEDLYGFKYTISACNNICEHYLLAENCGCYKGFYLKYYTKQQLATLPPCNLTLDSVHRACYDRIQHEVYETQSKKCSCPLPCKEVRFEVDISSISMRHQSDDILWGTFVEYNCGVGEYQYAGRRVTECEKMMNVSGAAKTEYIRDNFATIHLYYKELSYTSYTEHISYERSQFISDFGGSLGLWLGASIFTLLEVLELITKITAICVRGKQQQHQQQKQQQQLKKQQHHKQSSNQHTTENKDDGADVPLQDTIV